MGKKSKRRKQRARGGGTGRRGTLHGRVGNSNGGDGNVQTLDSIAQASRTSADGNTIILPDGREIPKGQFDFARQFMERETGEAVPEPPKENDTQHQKRSQFSFGTHHDDTPIIKADLDRAIDIMDRKIAILCVDDCEDGMIEPTNLQREKVMSLRQCSSGIRSTANTGSAVPLGTYEQSIGSDMITDLVQEESQQSQEDHAEKKGSGMTTSHSQQQQQQQSSSITNVLTGQPMTVHDMEDSPLGAFFENLASKGLPVAVNPGKSQPGFLDLDEDELEQHIRNYCNSDLERRTAAATAEKEAVGLNGMPAFVRPLWPSFDSNGDEHPVSDGSLALTVQSGFPDVELALMRNFRYQYPDMFQQIVHGKIHPSKLPPIAIVAPVDLKQDEAYQCVRGLAVKLVVKERSEAKAQAAPADTLLAAGSAAFHPRPEMQTEQEESDANVVAHDGSNSVGQGQGQTVKCQICGGSSRKMVTLVCGDTCIFCRKCIIRHGRKETHCPVCLEVLCIDVHTAAAAICNRKHDECFWCQSTGHKGSMLLCEGCHDVGEVTTYCSPECQKTAWKTHKWTFKAHRESLRENMD